jgi:hypothetical protein
MPEIPAGEDYEQFLPVEDRDDHFVTVQMPRSALRALERDARAHRQAQAQAAGAEPVDTPLEPGEAELTGERRRLAQGAPPDRVQAIDPYQAAQEIHDKVLADGGQEKHALGAAINSLVNAAHRGDERVIISNQAGRRG